MRRATLSDFPEGDRGFCSPAGVARDWSSPPPCPWSPARKYRGTWNAASCPDGSPRLRGNFRRKARSAFQKKRGISLFIANPDSNRFRFCLFVMPIIVLIILVPTIKISREYRREKNAYIKLHTVYKYETCLASKPSTQSSTKTLEVPQYPCTTYQQDAYFPRCSTLRIQ